MEKTYYIYHIPSVKIGVSENPKTRVRAQGYSNFEIIEQHTCVKIASDREIQLQKEYGYKIDPIPYYKTILSPTLEGRSKGGKLGGKIGGPIGGKIGGKTPRYSQRKLNYQTAEYIRVQYARKIDMFGNPISQNRLAKIFNVDQGAIWSILKNKTYTQP